MIVGSLLLILVAVAMLGLGLVQGSNAFLVGSIAASLLAAVALVVGARRAAGARATVAGDAYDGLGADEASPSRTDKRAVAERAPRESTRRRTEGTVYGRDGDRSEEAVGTLVEDEPDVDREAVAIPNQPGAPADVDPRLDEDADDADPPDEPARQH